MRVRAQLDLSVPTMAWVVGVIVLWPLVYYVCGALSGLIVFALLPVLSGAADAVGISISMESLFGILKFVTQASLGFVLAYALVRIAVDAGAPCMVWRAAAIMSVLGFVSAAIFSAIFSGGVDAGFLGVATMMSLSLALAGFMALGACRGASVRS